MEQRRGFESFTAQLKAPKSGSSAATKLRLGAVEAAQRLPPDADGREPLELAAGAFRPCHVALTWLGDAGITVAIAPNESP